MAWPIWLPNSGGSPCNCGSPGHAGVVCNSIQQCSKPLATSTHSKRHFRPSVASRRVWKQRHSFISSCSPKMFSLSSIQTGIHGWSERTTLGLQLAKTCTSVQDSRWSLSGLPLLQKSLLSIRHVQRQLRYLLSITVPQSAIDQSQIKPSHQCGRCLSGPDQEQSAPMP